MTLFVTTPNRRYEISDAYIILLSFLIFYAVGIIVKGVVEKQKMSKTWLILGGGGYRA